MLFFPHILVSPHIQDVNCSGTLGFPQGQVTESRTGFIKQPNVNILTYLLTYFNLNLSGARTRTYCQAEAQN